MEDARPGEDAQRDAARARELDFEVDVMAALAEVEAEHRRTLGQPLSPYTDPRSPTTNS